MPTLVAELIGLGAGVLIVVGPAAIKATAQATKSIPIVAIDLETDPIRAGLAASVSRPGGNVTGLFLDQPSLAGKWLQLLREAAPNIERVALIWDPSSAPDQLDAAKAAPRAMSLEPFVLELRTSDGFEAAFRTLGNEPKTGIVQIGLSRIVCVSFALERRVSKTSVAYNVVPQAPCEGWRTHELRTQL